MRAMIAVALVVPAVALAEPRHDADAHARRGIALYNLGHFEDAIIEFEQAYELVQSDELLFNLAQAHRKLDHCAPALRYYHQFLASSPAPALAAQVEALMPKLELACKAKEEPPTGSSPTPETKTATAPVETPPPEVHATAPEVSELPLFRVAASGVVGGVVSGGTASTTGFRIEATTPVGPIEVGGALGIGELWRGMADRNATLAQLAVAASYRITFDRIRVTLDGEIGAAYVSSLDISSGVVPGITGAGQWAPLARGEIGAEHDVAPSWAVRAGLALGFAPRMGDMDAPIGEVDLLVGAVYTR